MKTLSLGLPDEQAATLEAIALADEMSVSRDDPPSTRQPDQPAS
jgi:hypothetical protein